MTVDNKQSLIEIPYTTLGGKIIQKGDVLETLGGDAQWFSDHFIDLDRVGEDGNGICGKHLPPGGWICNRRIHSDGLHIGTSFSNESQNEIGFIFFEGPEESPQFDVSIVKTALSDIQSILKEL